VVDVFFGRSGIGAESRGIGGSLRRCDDSLKVYHEGELSMAARVIRWCGRRRVLTQPPLIRLDSDPREAPIYGVREAADYVGVPRSTLRHWLATPKHGVAVILTPDGANDLSFYNLLEAHILRVAIERHVTLPRIRIAVETLRERAPGSAHPLLEQEIFTGGPFRSLFVKSLAGVEDIGHSGQLAIRKFLTRFLTRIDRDQNGPYQLRPYGFQHVAINHRIAGGQPVVKGTGILIELLAARRRGGESVLDLASDYRIPVHDVRDAIKYSRAA
jgi:uncharacterized protein (DUF433 family)